MLSTNSGVSVTSVGIDDTGRKEVLGVLDGHRESEASWTELIEQLRAQGLQLAPKLAIGDGALGFWKAVAKCWPQTTQQSTGFISEQPPQ